MKISGEASAAPRRTSTGQALTEFALVIPILIILFVAIADFGRIFQTGITLEAAARNAAETTASAYLAAPPGPLDWPAPVAVAAYYQGLHQIAARTVCAETRGLPNSNYDTTTTDCPGMPLIQVCVHDGQDSECTLEHYGQALPTQCAELAVAPTNATEPGYRWVEVRACYQFTPLVTIPLLPFGDFWLQRTRVFDIPCYFVLGTQACG